MKKTVLYIANLMHYRAREVLCNLFRTNQGSSSKMIFVAGATKINLKNMKT